MRDSYERFFSTGYISKEQFFDFGIQETIYAPLDKASECWEELKQRIKNNDPVYIRGFGRNGNKSNLYQEFYSKVLGNNYVMIDPTNNREPSTLIQEMTGYFKSKNSNKPIRNYQVSHIFGKTKNIYTFTAPWNIVFQPKLIDPFTGHEAKGALINEYQTMFKLNSYKQFKSLIEDYNQIITDNELQKRIESYFEEMSSSEHCHMNDIKLLKKSVYEELTPILFESIG